MKIEIKEECKGCLVYRGYCGSCGLGRDSEFAEKCPCKTCLTKGMCQNICEDFMGLLESLGRSTLK